MVDAHDVVSADDTALRPEPKIPLSPRAAFMLFARQHPNRHNPDTGTVTNRDNTGQGRVRSTTEGPIRWIIFDNPARMNALNLSMWSALPALISEAEADPSIRVIVFRGGSGKAFSAGADISEFDRVRNSDNATHYDAVNHDAFEAIAGCAKPTIAMTEGYCLGGGLILALNCDLRIAAEGARFAIPMARLGVGYDARWIRPVFSAVSPARAKEILFTGRRFTDAEALAMGLVNAVHPAGRIAEETRALAAEIAANAPLSLRVAKRTVDEFSRSPENPDLAALDELIAACIGSEDYEEGRRAFLEKRKPNFRGR